VSLFPLVTFQSKPQFLTKGEFESRVTEYLSKLVELNNNAVLLWQSE
jgi:hypothetical protein